MSLKKLSCLGILFVLTFWSVGIAALLFYDAYRNNEIQIPAIGSSEKSFTDIYKVKKNLRWNGGDMIAFSVFMSEKYGDFHVSYVRVYENNYTYDIEVNMTENAIEMFTKYSSKDMQEWMNYLVDDVNDYMLLKTYTLRFWYEPSLSKRETYKSLLSGDGKSIWFAKIERNRYEKTVLFNPALKIYKPK